MVNNNKEALKGTQRCRRFPFTADAYVIDNGRRLGMSIENVSALGLKAHISDPIEVGQTYALTISDAFLKDAQIIAKAVWDNQDNTIGFEVLNNNECWQKFIQNLEEQA